MRLSVILSFICIISWVGQTPVFAEMLQKKAHCCLFFYEDSGKGSGFVSILKYDMARIFGGHSLHFKVSQYTYGCIAIPYQTSNIHQYSCSVDLGPTAKFNSLQYFPMIICNTCHNVERSCRYAWYFKVER